MSVPNGQGKMLVAVVLILLALALAPTVLSKSMLYQLTDIAILGMFAISFNLLFGYGGALSFGHAAYFGLGAYGTALILKHIGSLPVLFAIPLGAAVAMIGGVAIGAFCVRRRGVFFAMLTLAFGMLLYVVAWKWRGLTAGDDGFGGYLPGEFYVPMIGAISNGDWVQLYYLVLLVSMLVLSLVWALMTITPFGNAVAAIRQNEERASFLGYNVFVIKLSNYTVAAGLAGVAGALHAVFHNFVSTSIIGLDLSTEVVMVTFIGGTGWFLGPLLGAAFYISLSDILSGLMERWQIVMGIIFVFMVMYAPRGLAGGVAVIANGGVLRPLRCLGAAKMTVGNHNADSTKESAQ